jgi:hypothetical protein
MFNLAIVLAFFNALSVNAWCSYGGSQTTVGECCDGSVSVYQTLTYSDNDSCATTTGSAVPCDYEAVTSDYEEPATTDYEEPTVTSTVIPVVTETVVTEGPIDIISSAVGLSSVLALISLLMF